MFGGVVMPLLIKQFEPDLPRGALGPLVQVNAAIAHVKQAFTVAASPSNKFEVKDVALGCTGLVGLVVGNPLLIRRGIFAGIHAGTPQKAQRNFSPSARATGGFCLALAQVSIFFALFAKLFCEKTSQKIVSWFEQKLINLSSSRRR